jgi:hypothetical protein
VRAELDPADLECALCDAEHLGAVDGGEPAGKQSTTSPRANGEIPPGDGAMPGFHVFPTSEDIHLDSVSGNRPFPWDPAWS